MSRTIAQVDLDAIRRNVATLDAASGSAAVMAVVKADGYGHGMLPCARAALDGGARWLGVAFAEEALELRTAGIAAPILAWVAAPGDDIDALVANNVDVGVGAAWTLEAAVAAAVANGGSARVHLKVDTGLGRGGVTPAEWPAFVDDAARAVRDGRLVVTGVWSHLAYADDPAHPTIAAQNAQFQAALDVVKAAGLEPEVRHLANSAATLRLPETHYDLVRPGIAVYGLSPGPLVGRAHDLGLTPAMTLQSHVALTKRVPAGHGVSYGHRYTTASETTLALVPLGYADGIPRHATNLGPVAIGGKRFTVAGTVCMDQFVVDVGDSSVRAGDVVTVFGTGADGEPTADDWAEAIGTINYEIVTRIGSRVPRHYVGIR